MRQSPTFKAFRAQAGGGTPVAALASPPLITIVDDEWQPQLARPARPFGAIHHGSLQGHSDEVASTPGRLNSSCLMHPHKGARDTHGVHFAVEQIVESMDDATLPRCVLSRSTTYSSARQQARPGDAQRAPMSDLSMHRGRWVDALGRLVSTGSAC